MEGTLRQIGERNAILEIRRVFGKEWPCDDSFYFEQGGRYLLLTTDAITKEGHMPEGADPERIGYFLAAVNLSDIAAMGGTPRYFMASMMMPGRTRISYVRSIEMGIARCLRRYGVEMGGGDLKEGPLAMAGVALGDVPRKEILRRDSVHEGDLLCVTGRLGRNAAAYSLWKDGRGRRWANELICVEPRIREGRFIAKHGASAAMDLSDGVYSAVSQLRELNGRGFEIDFSALPVDRLAAEVSRRKGVPIEELALGFGGEYELLFTASSERYGRMAREAKKEGIAISCIGRVSGRENVLVREGRRIRITGMGYQHFVR